MLRRVLAGCALGAVAIVGLPLAAAVAETAEPPLPDVPVVSAEDGAAELEVELNSGDGGPSVPAESDSAEGAADGGVESVSEGDTAPALFDAVFGYHGDGWVFVSEHIGEVIPECVVDIKYVCPGPEDRAAFAPSAEADPAASVASFSSVEALVTRVLVDLRVPRPGVRIGPAPSANEWDMAVVGYPLWLWTEEPATRSATVRAYGYDFVLAAERGSVRFDMGDSSEPFVCESMTPYPGDEAVGVESPDCGHRFVRPSLPEGRFTVTVTAEWVVRWSAAGFSGTLPMPMTSVVSVPVGELQSIRVR